MNQKLQRIVTSDDDSYVLLTNNSQHQIDILNEIPLFVKINIPLLKQVKDKDKDEYIY